MGEPEPKFAVLAEKREYEKPLYLHDLHFGALVTEVVTPYEEKKAFSIDGVPVSKIKVIKQAPEFGEQFSRLHDLVAYHMGSGHRIPIQDYPGRLDALFRGSGVDITNSLINAYHEKKKLNLPKEEFAKGILSLVTEAVKWKMGGSGSA